MITIAVVVIFGSRAQVQLASGGSWKPLGALLAAVVFLDSRMRATVENCFCDSPVPTELV